MKQLYMSVRRKGKPLKTKKKGRGPLILRVSPSGVRPRIKKKWEIGKISEGEVRGVSLQGSREGLVGPNETSFWGPSRRGTRRRLRERTLV